MSTERPFAPACERNREPILSRLEDWLAPQASILEIGSGTGQHAAWFCARQHGWRWQCSDVPENLPGIRAWLEDLPAGRCPPPRALDVSRGPWPSDHYDAIFTANTLHIMAWPLVEQMFAGLPAVLAPAAQLIIYGPFNYAGRHSSPSNADFDAWLRERDPRQGIRDIAAVSALAEKAGLTLKQDEAMPANNRLLRFARSAVPPGR